MVQLQRKSDFPPSNLSLIEQSKTARSPIQQLQYTPLSQHLQYLQHVQYLQHLPSLQLLQYLPHNTCSTDVPYTGYNTYNNYNTHNNNNNNKSYLTDNTHTTCDTRGNRDLGSQRKSTATNRETGSPWDAAKPLSHEPHSFSCTATGRQTQRSPWVRVLDQAQCHLNSHEVGLKGIFGEMALAAVTHKNADAV